MKNLTATICLTIAVLLGSAEVSWGVDLQNYESVDDAEFFTFLAAVILFFIFIIVSLFGVIKTFRRQPVVAILCIIFLMPIYIIWAFVNYLLGLFTRNNSPVSASLKTTRAVELTVPQTQPCTYRSITERSSDSR